MKNFKHLDCVSEDERETKRQGTLTEPTLLFCWRGCSSEAATSVLGSRCSCTLAKLKKKWSKSVPNLGRKISRWLTASKWRAFQLTSYSDVMPFLNDRVHLSRTSLLDTLVPFLLPSLSVILVAALGISFWAQQPFYWKSDDAKIILLSRLSGPIEPTSLY